MQEKDVKITSEDIEEILEIEEFNKISRKLSSIEHKYSKHLPVDVIIYLIKIQQNIGLLDNAIRLKPNIKKFTTKVSKLTIKNKTMRKKLLDSAVDLNEIFGHQEHFIAGPIENLLNNLEKLYSLECDFDHVVNRSEIRERMKDYT